MATEFGTENWLTKDRLIQLVNVGFPFNPVSGEEMSGQNLLRIRQAMPFFQWKDPRFVLRSEAVKNGWVIAPEAGSVGVKIRNQVTGDVSDVEMFNASDVRGMPSLSSMLAMSDSELAQLQGRAIEADDLEQDEEFSMQPVRSVLRSGPISEVVAGALATEEPALRADGLDGAGAGASAGIEGAAQDGRFAILASYWVNGLHNAEGIALANKLNAVIKEKGLAEDEQAIARLLSIHEKARQLGLSVVSEQKYLNDPFRKANQAEPVSLLAGAFVRDKEGAYRPAGGGRAVLVDKGDSLSLKSKDKAGYAAAMELARAKGWTAIELKGKPAMMAEAWLEAKLIGLDVVNYKPSEKDIEKYNERLAQEAAVKAASVPAVDKHVEQSPEQVVVRPFVDANGQSKVATVTYTVCWEAGGQDDMSFNNPKDAARAFSTLPDATLPSVVRSVTRADGYVEDDVTVANTNLMRGEGAKAVSGMLDHEFAEAFEAVKEEEKAQASLGECVGSGLHSGKIVSVDHEVGRVVQKSGRDPAKVVVHDLKKLSRVPREGEIEDIAYDKHGNGMLAALGHEVEQSGGRELAR